VLWYPDVYQPIIQTMDRRGRYVLFPGEPVLSGCTYLIVGEAHVRQLLNWLNSDPTWPGWSSPPSGGTGPLHTLSASPRWRFVFSGDHPAERLQALVTARSVNMQAGSTAARYYRAGYRVQVDPDGSWSIL
jgi:hypothetical protein